MTYNTISLVAIATGVTLLATSAGLNIAASQDGCIPAMVAIIAVAIGTVAAVPTALSAWQDRRWRNALATLVLILVGEGLDGWNSFERLLSVRVDRASAIATTNGPRKAAEDRLAEAKAAYAKADDAATDEARHGGCRSVCHALREDADRARQEVETARMALAKLAPERNTHLSASVIHRSRHDRGRDRARILSRSEPSWPCARGDRRPRQFVSDSTGSFSIPDRRAFKGAARTRSSGSSIGSR